MRKSDKLTYTLSKRALIVLVVFYMVLIITGLVLAIDIIIKIPTIKNEDIILYTIISSFSVCGMLSSIQYFKRIYKALITNRVEHPQAKCSSEEIGNMLYFITRPIFSFVFIIVFIFCILSGFAIVTGSLDSVINIRFLYLSVIASSFIGYSFGQILDRFESYSKSQVKKTFDRMEDGDNE